MRKIVTSALLSLAFCTSYAQTQTVEVVEFHPAPGQFVNVLPAASEGTTHSDICQKATENLNNNGLVHLGTYGGYITVKFDHPIQNKRGSDLRILGNAFYSETTLIGSIEPGIVYVGVGNDVETCKWYELAGSEYYTTEVHDFSITYHKPTAEEGEHVQNSSIYDNYIQWEATWTDKNGERRDSTGYHMKNSWHRQTYWPLWEDCETMTFKGGKLPNNAVQQGTTWNQYRYAKDAYGYVDASSNTDVYSTFDIDWAVDADGNHVDLTEVNFIKVVCGIFQYCGMLGETSTEVSGFQDLHLVDGYDDNPIIITPRTPTGISTVMTSSFAAKDDSYYDLTGRRVANPTKGIFIKNGKKYIFK